ncbi:MAG: sensor histidine kinase [Pseudomonadota bacterium]
MMNSIRTRLLIWLLIPLTGVAAIVSLETFYSAQRVSKDLHDRTLLAAMLTLSENIVASSGSLLAENTLEILTENLGDEFFYYVTGPRGAFVTGYSGYPRIPEGMALEDETPIFYDGEYNGRHVRVTAVRQFLSGGLLNGWTTITTWQNTTTRDQLTISLFGRSLLRLFAVVLAAGAIVWFAVSRGLRPISELQQAIDNRTSQDLAPIKRAMPVELSGIVIAMNELFKRVARSKQNREQFIGNAAHQLRNPVAAIKVQAQAALASDKKPELKLALKEIVRTSDDTGKMINQMLSSASAHALSSENMKDIDLCKIVEHAAQTIAASALEKGQEISLDMDVETLPYRGHEILLREAIVNLVDNAVRHNSGDSKISVSLSISSDDQMIEIGVADDGEPLDEDTLLRFSQPFSTGEDTNSGSGLGLSLAKDVAKSHGGNLIVRSHDGDPETFGKTILVLLPRIRGNFSA